MSSSIEIETFLAQPAPLIHGDLFSRLIREVHKSCMMDIATMSMVKPITTQAFDTNSRQLRLRSFKVECVETKAHCSAWSKLSQIQPKLSKLQIWTKEEHYNGFQTSVVR